LLFNVSSGQPFISDNAWRCRRISNPDYPTQKDHPEEKTEQQIGDSMTNLANAKKENWSK